ncbi:MAG TPA: antitoxin AF2212-like protein [Gemmataceae bacterium]|nr:antitoxin AF2212-like protein [Gemmataceae bacterium]
MITVKARYNGEVFVPLEPVGIPVGVCVDVIVMPREATPDEEQHFQEVMKQMLEGAPARAADE